MATVFIEGFDKYGPPSVTGARLQDLLSGEWSTIPSAMAIVSPLSATGYAIQLQSLTSFVRPTGTLSRIIGGFRFTSTLGSAAGVTFMDGGSSQSSVSVDGTTGTISMRNGGVTGTVLGTSSQFVSSGATHYLEWDVTFGNSGAYKVWLDGVKVLDSTGDSTTTANNSCTGINLNCGASETFVVDDLYVFDTTGSVCNAVLNTSPVVDTQFPTSDSSVQFSFGAGFVGYAESLTNSTNAPGANELVLHKITPSQNCTYASVGIMPSATSAGAKFKAVIYNDSGGAPHTLLDTGTEVTGTTAGTALTLPATSTQALTSGTQYWIGYITDTSVTLHMYDSSAVGYKKSNTYGSGAPTPDPAMTSGQSTWQMWANVTGGGSNYIELANNPPGPADLSYISDSTVGHEDLYGFHALSISPSAVYTVAVKAFCRDSDAGARTITMQCKSSGTDTASGSVAPSTSYGWCSGYYDVDPNTSSAWANAAAVNSATSGFKLAT